MEVCKEWVYNCLQNFSFISEGQELMTGSVGQQRIKPEFVQNYSIPFPPLAEQKRIVAEIAQEEAIVTQCKSLIAMMNKKIQNKINALWEVGEKPPTTHL